MITEAAFLAETVFSGFISKIINNGIDVSWNTIKQADKNRRGHNRNGKNNEDENIQVQIYHIIIDVLNRMTDQCYAGEDLLYQAAEKILKGCQENGNKLPDTDNITSGLQDLMLYVSEEKCREFAKLFGEELSREDHLELYREVLLSVCNEKDACGKKQLLHLLHIDGKLEEITAVLNKMAADGTETIAETIAVSDGIFLDSKKQDYIAHWKERLFLHLYNDERPLTLSDTFIMPRYKMRKNAGYLKFPETGTMDDAVRQFVRLKRSSSMLVTGSPGIGKTSFLSWLANECKEDDSVIVLRFRDWEAEDFTHGLLRAVLSALGCKKADLENKVLILDGYDEWKRIHEGAVILNSFFNEVSDYKNFKFIVTSRSNYVRASGFPYEAEMLAFNEDEIRKFYRILKGEELQDPVWYSDVLGIPVILYMAVMSEIDWKVYASKYQLYSCIFAVKGGIFDKFSFQGAGYDYGAHPYRIRENIIAYLTFLKKTAFAMFEKNSLSLEQGEFQSPGIKFQGETLNILEFPLKFLFDCTEDRIEFVHKSIYEYFTAEYIYEAVKHASAAGKEELACALGNLLNQNLLSKEILEFLNGKSYREKISGLGARMRETVSMMLEDGMLYYTNKSFKKVIDCELTVFQNLIGIIHLDFYEIYKDKFYASIYYYLKYTEGEINFSFMNFSEEDFSYKSLNDVKFDRAVLCRTNFRGANLRSVNFEFANLEKAILKEADLTCAKFEDTNLFQADLEKANLRGACVYNSNLRETNLKYADFEGAELCESDFRNANMQHAHLKGVNLGDVWLKDTDLSRASLENAYVKSAVLDDVNLTGTNLKGAYFGYAHFRNIDLKGINLRGVNIQASFWTKDALRKSLDQLMDADFEFIYIDHEKQIHEDGRYTQVYRKELFLNTENCFTAGSDGS